MTYYLKRGNSFFVTPKQALDIHEILPAGNYTIQQDDSGDLYLETIDKFTDISRHYGNNLRHAERMYSTFKHREQSTGVMLTGQKGSGKSLLAKTLSLRGYEDNVPTIVINAPWHGDKFNKFIQTIQQPTIILFDEFEKVYDQDEQEDILTLLDGVYPTKKLFVITCNDKWRVDYNMRNRPGRIFYMLDFKGLDVSFIREYCEENLKDKQYVEKTCTITSLFSDFNFDMLKALVEEMNRYDEDPASALQLLNIKPEYETPRSFTPTLFIDGKVQEIDDDEWEGNPLNAEMSISYRKYNNTKDKRDFNWASSSFVTSDIEKIDSSRGIYIFRNRKNEVLTLKEIRIKSYNYLDHAV